MNAPGLTPPAPAAKLWAAPTGSAGSDDSFYPLRRRMSAAGTAAFWLSGGEGRRFRVEVPLESPLFAGHFPGRPILPGIAHLAIVERALGTSLAAVRALKLRRPVLPGEVLDLLLGPSGEGGWTRFEIGRGGEAVSSGSVAPGGSEAAGQEGGAAARPGPPGGADFPPAEALLPHAPPARLVRSIVEASREEIVCVAEAPLLHPLAEGGRLPALVGIEAAAQAAAALEALSRRGEDPGPRIGYLVGVREARFAAPFLPAGRPWRATARLAGGAFPLSVYEIGVGEPGREVVAGSISTYLAGPTRGG